MIFANPCKGDSAGGAIPQLKKYVDAGFLVGNHTCTHPRLDNVGFMQFSKDAAKADTLLGPLYKDQKFFRYPFLNESKDEKLRDQMRDWLKANQYQNGMVSIDNDEYIFSWAINKAKVSGKKIDYKKIEALFLKHLIGAVEFYEQLAVKDAYKDKLYLEHPKTLYADNGIIAQVAMEKTGLRIGYNFFDDVKAELIKILGL